MAQNLSEDLLYAIFLHALPSKFLLTATGSWREPCAIQPLNFSLVCHSWRTVVLSHPKLWSEMNIENELNFRRDYRDQITRDFVILKKWLSHSSPSASSFQRISTLIYFTFCLSCLPIGSLTHRSGPSTIEVVLCRVDGGPGKARSSPVPLGSLP